MKSRARKPWRLTALPGQTIAPMRGVWFNKPLADIESLMFVIRLTRACVYEGQHYQIERRVKRRNRVIWEAWLPGMS